MESADDLLAQVKAEFEERDKPLEPRKPQHIQIEQILQQQGSNDRVRVFEAKAPSRESFASPENSLIAQVKAEFEEQQRAENLKKQQQQREEQLRQEQLEQQQREALSSHALAWLEQLDPLSAEGLWFEDLARGYPSKLEAAIDCLQTWGQNQS